MYSAGPSSKPLAPVFHKSGGSASAAARANSLAEAKRRLDRACDQCRRRKTKCDGATKTDNICSNCLQNHHRCTYIEGSKPRGPPKAYVTSLEDRLERMEALLKRLRPEDDFSERLGPPILRDSWKNSFPQQSGSDSRAADFSVRKRRSSQHLNAHRPAQDSFETKLPSIAVHRSESPDSFDDSDEEGYTETSIISGLKHLTMHGLDSVADQIGTSEPRREGGDTQLRFHGKSSSIHLIAPTREFKLQYMEESGSPRDSFTEDPTSKRKFFWNSLPWEIAWEGIQITSPYFFRTLAENFPPPDLARSLIDLYFSRLNIMYPLLHRPTFHKQWEEGLHREDVWFAALCMSVFANASRWSDDPRVLEMRPELVPPSSDRRHWGFAGYGYYSTALEVFRLRKSVIYPASLFELQLHCLLSKYLTFHFVSSAPWIFTTVGLRKAQDVGIHRQKLYHQIPRVEDELWKRAFWILTAQDRSAAIALGRACSAREEDIDVELPIEVDDEYWISDIPGREFKQPQGKLSVNTAFNLWIKLSKVGAFALRTIYAADKSKVAPSGVSGAQWRQQVVKQLNTAMGEWVDSVPDHLRWSDRMGSTVFANQSATLYLAYYMTQILIYRTFIPPITLDGLSSHRAPHVELPYPSLAICINAAKACLRILEIQLEVGMMDIPYSIGASQVCAAILINHIWRLKAQARSQKMSTVEDVKPVPGQTIPEIMVDVNKFIGILGNAAKRWPLAGFMQKHLRETLPTELGGISDSGNVGHRVEKPTKNITSSTKSQSPDSGPSTKERQSPDAEYDPSPFPTSTPAFSETRSPAPVSKPWHFGGTLPIPSTWPSDERRPLPNGWQSAGERRIQLSASSCYDAGGYRASYEFTPSGSPYDPPLSISQLEKRASFIRRPSQGTWEPHTIKREINESSLYNQVPRPILSRRPSQTVFLDEEWVDESFSRRQSYGVSSNAREAWG